MAYLIVVLLLFAVIWIVIEPLRRRTVERPGRKDTVATKRIELEAARDAKYREIRDAELDHQTGKLSDDDFAAVDSTLRAEAIELLHQLDALAGPDTVQELPTTNEPSWQEDGGSLGQAAQAADE